MEAIIEKVSVSSNEREIAIKSYNALNSALSQITTNNLSFEILETKKKIKIPLVALNHLSEVLKTMSLGKEVAIVLVAKELTTQKAAEVLGCSRPHVVKLLESGEIQFSKVGKHRKIDVNDLMDYKKKLKESQKQYIIDIMRADEESGLYE